MTPLWLLGICGAAAMLPPGKARAARAEPQSISGVYVLQGNYVPDRWTPVRLQLRNDSDQPVSGTAHIAERRPIVNSSGASAVFEQPVFVPPRAKVTVVGYAYFPQPPPTPGAPKAVGGPVAPIVWRGAGGDQIASTDIHGQAASAGIVLSCGTRNGEDVHAIYGLADALAEILPNKPRALEAQPTELPREPAGYDGVRALVLDAIDPDALDVAQRRAIEQYVRRGGVLVVPCPPESMRLESSWLDELMPVTILGWRRTDRGELPLVEAIERDATCRAVVRDEGFAHAVYRPLGAGRVVFTSMPLNALPARTPGTSAIWRQLLGWDRPSHDWRENGMLDRADDRGVAQPQEQLMQSLIGLSVPPWTLAAAFAGAYVLSVLAVQVFVRGARRPLGYAIVTGLAIGISAVVLLMQSGQGQGEALSGGRLVSIEMGPGGGGRQQESLVLQGERDRSLSVMASDASATVWPAIAPDSNPARISMLPGGAPGAGAAPRPERYWLIDSAVAAEKRVAASVRFDAEGAHLSIDNEFGQPLRMALLVSGPNSYRLGDVPVGKSTHALATRNEPGNYTMASVLSEQSRLRERFYEALRLMPAAWNSDRIVLPALGLVGWADEAPIPVELSRPIARPMRQQAMVRVPVRVEPLKIGSPVKIDGAFVQLVYSSLVGLPYDTQRRRWTGKLNQSGAWQIGFAPPADIGKIRIERATVRLDVQAPGANVSIAGRSGTDRHTWAGPIGAQSTTITPKPRDVDENGWLWIDLRIDAPPGPDGLPPAWEVRDLTATYEGEVVGPPYIPIVPRAQTGAPPRRPNNVR